MKSLSISALIYAAFIAFPAVASAPLDYDDARHLLNRTGFAHRVRSILDGNRRADEHVGLLFVDLDGFKRVNDDYGHDVGDELLRLAAERLARLFRRADDVARLGGDEFAVILAGVKTDAEVSMAARRVTEAFTVPFAVAREPVRVLASVSASETLSICALESMRFIKPLSAFPGPNSINRVKPCPSRYRIDASHRTGAVTCSTSRR